MNQNEYLWSKGLGYCCLNERFVAKLFFCEWCLMPFLTIFQLYRGGQCTYPCFPGVLLTSTLHNILSKPLTAFPLNHCRNNGQLRERNESCRNDYHQSSEKILAKPGIEPVLESAVLPAELWGSALWLNIDKNHFVGQTVNHNVSCYR